MAKDLTNKPQVLIADESDLPILRDAFCSNPDMTESDWHEYVMMLLQGKALAFVLYRKGQKVATLCAYYDQDAVVLGHFYRVPGAPPSEFIEDCHALREKLLWYLKLVKPKTVYAFIRKKHPRHDALLRLYDRLLGLKPDDTTTLEADIQTVLNKCSEVP